MLAVSVDDLRRAEQVVQESGIPFPVLYDPSRQVPAAYMVYDLLGDGLSAPATFVVDPAGVITWKYVGRSLGDRPRTSELLDQLAQISG